MRPLLFLALVTAAHAARLPDFTAALEHAKAEHTPFAVYFHGSDWNKPGEKLLAVWNDPRFESGLDPAMPLVTIDRKEAPSPADEELAKRNAACDPPLRSLPAVALFDSDGRLVASLAGTPEIEKAGGLPRALAGMLAVLKDRDLAWERARKSSGLQRANLLGSGLDRMNLGLGPKNVYQTVLEEMKKADPKDQSGYLAKYTFSSRALLDMVMKRAEAGEQAEAEKELAALARQPRLDKKQLQELHAARFALYQRWPDKKDQSRRALEDMRRADPRSDLGRAANRYADQLEH